MITYNNELNEKKCLSAIGLKYGLFFLLVMLLQIGLALVASLKTELIVQDNRLILAYLILIISTYVIGYPFLRFILRNMPEEKPVHNKLGISLFIRILVCMTGFFVIGVTFGQVADKLINSLLNIGTNNSGPHETIESIDTIYTFITVGVLGPIFEELIFRKKLIDHSIKYGEGIAIILSGLMFGLFHTSVKQLFYTTGMGMLSAYVYIKTGKIRYSIILHMINNITTSVLLLEIAKRLERSDIFENSNAANLSFESVLCLTLLIIIVVLAIFSVCYVIKSFKSFFKTAKKYDFIGAAHSMLSSPGIWFYFILCIAATIINYVT